MRANTTGPLLTGDHMKRWWLTVILAAIAIGLSVYLILKPDETARLVAEYGRDKTVGPRVVELGASAVAPLCEALERLPASDLSKADKQAMVNYVVALDAVSGGWPYTATQSMPVLLTMLKEMEDREARNLLVETVGRSFKQLAVPAILDVLEDEFRLSEADGPESLPSEPVVSDLLKRLGAGRCLPVLAARLETTSGDFRKHLLDLVIGFAPDEQVDRILARALEQETDPARRAWLTEKIQGLKEQARSADATAP